MGLISGPKSKEASGACFVQRHGFEMPHHSPGAEARDGVETGTSDPPEQPTPQGYGRQAGTMPKVRPGEERGTPLPTSSESWVALPSAVISGNSSS